MNEMEDIVTQRMHEENAAFPLSQSQQNIWDLEKAYSGTSINHITTSVRIQGQFRLDLLQKSIRLLLESDSSLRTRIEMREGKLVQYIVPMEEEAVPVFDFSLSGQDGVENWRRALAREPMPVLGGALCRFWLFKTGENDGGILMKLHHLISDGWSQVLLCNKLQKIYLDLLEGRTVQLPPAPEYRLHVSEEQQYLQSAACRKDEAYWGSALRAKLRAGLAPAGSQRGGQPGGRAQKLSAAQKCQLCDDAFLPAAAGGAFCCVLHGLGHLSEKSGPPGKSRDWRSGV